MDNPLVILIVAVLGMAGVVILVYLAVAWLREARSRRPAPASPEPAAETQQAAEAQPAAGARPADPEPPRPTLSTDEHENESEVLRVVRDRQTGRVTVAISGRRYGSPAELNDPQALQALRAALADLAPFAGHTEAVEAPASAPRPNAASRAAAPAAASAAPGPLPPPTMNPFRQVQVLRELHKNPPPAPKTILAQIDEVLQEQAAGTTLAERGLRVGTGPKGAAQFHLDGQEYDSVDAVPDEEARALIRRATKAWEAKQ